MDPLKILIVEDDKIQNDVLAAFLRKDGDDVVSAYTLSEAEEVFDPSFKLVVLDVMLPDGSGIDFLRSIRRISTQTFDLHADEYVDKPVSPQVMTRRIHALTDRIYGQGSSCTVKGYTFDFPRYLVIDQKGNEIHFTNKEMGILRYLLENRGKAVSRDSLITNLWGCEYESEERAIDTHIKNIRKKLDPDIILTIKGIGYRLNL